MTRLCIMLCVLFSPWLMRAQNADDAALFATISSKDSLLFQEGFNRCDLRQFESLLSAAFTFYHDEAGPTLSKAAFIKDIREGLCKLPYKPTRRLVPNSMRVHPLKKAGVLYGAVREGEHAFYASEAGKPEYLTSTARFTHLWSLEKGEWKLTQALSYNHRTPGKSATRTHDSLLSHDRAITEKWMAERRIPALGIGYIRNGKIQQAVVFGRDETGRPYPTNTLFNVASLTKPVTTLVALKLVSAGKWSLDEPLSRYWTDPDVADDPRSKLVTTRQVLTHQTGFPNWRSDSGSRKLSFGFNPGTKHQYSGEGFEYLRKALEAKFGKPLNQLADELVFTPLGMRDTRFFWDSSVDEARFAKGHRSDGSLYVTYRNGSPNAADDLLTTVEDYSSFLLHMLNGAGLTRELFAEMQSEQLRLGARRAYGLGWQVVEEVRGSENALWHGGDDVGVHAIAFMLPASGEGLLIFTACDNGTDVYAPILQHFLGTAGEEIVAVETGQ